MQPLACGQFGRALPWASRPQHWVFLRCVYLGLSGPQLPHACVYKHGFHRQTHADETMVQLMLMSGLLSYVERCACVWEE